MKIHRIEMNKIKQFILAYMPWRSVVKKVDRRRKLIASMQRLERHLWLPKTTRVPEKKAGVLDVLWVRLGMLQRAQAVHCGQALKLSALPLAVLQVSFLKMRKF